MELNLSFLKDKQNFIEGFCVSTNNDAYKFLRRLNQEQTFPEKMKYRGQDLKGSQQIAESFNEHFSSVFIEDKSHIVVPETAQPEIFLDDITFNAKDVLDEISQIKSGANFYDQITPSLPSASALLTLANFPKSGKTYTCVLISKMVAKRKLKTTDQSQCSVQFLWFLKE